MNATIEQLLTSDEAMKRLQVSRSKLHELVRDGKLKAVKDGRWTRFREQALREFIDAAESRAKPAVLVGGT